MELTAMIVQFIITASLIFKFALGVAIGSFLNVGSLRYSDAGWNVHGRSRCPYCGQFLRWYELVPLLSFLLQKGRCRSCGTKLSLQYPAAELLGGLIAVFLPLIWWIPAFILLLISLIDFRLKIIPNGLVIALAGWGVIEGILAGGISGLIDNFSASILSALFFFLVVVITRSRGMGWGDVKLGAALGLWLGLTGILYALISAFILGAIFGAFLLITKKRGLKDAIPFGPFLAIGAILAQSNFF